MTERISDELLQVYANAPSRAELDFMKMAKELIERRAAERDSGMVMVPKEPTIELLQAWHSRYFEAAGTLDPRSIDYALYVECYRTMLEAAASEKSGE